MKFLLTLTFSTVISIPVIAQDYYDGTEGLTGEALKKKLHEIIRDHPVRSYSEFRDVILPDLDEDPNNSSNIILFYKNNSIPKADFANDDDSWNREHTWPTSHGFSNTSDTAYTDIHNLRPSDASVNTSKSNKDFDEIDHTPENEQGEAPDTYTNDDFWEPRDEIKGDVARILFYMDVRYNSDRLDLKLVDRESFSDDPEIGVLYTLIKWHELDPVDNAEITRHEGAVGYQGNRNPFIDHPEWVESIWGNSTDPLLILNELSFSRDFGEVAIGSESVQQYKINAYNLESSVTVSTEAPFSVSGDGTNWSESISLGESGESETFTVFLRFQP
ncbi:MAG: endonuclease, partial [Proteobacteria bacterium]|nr:endonuclease [Pseudomonadota bacterium]